MDKYLLISLGAIVGANLRYLIGGWVSERFGSSLPMALSSSILAAVYL